MRNLQMVMFVLQGERIGSNSVMVQPKVDVLAFGIRFPVIKLIPKKNNSPGGWILRSIKFEPYPNDMFKAPMGSSFGISHVSSLYVFLLSVKHSARCSMYIYMYIYTVYSSMPWILESLNLNIDEELSKALLHFEIDVWYIFPKKQQVENRPLKHQTPNLESIMFEFTYVKFWVNFKFGVFSPNLKDPFVWTESHGFHDCQHPYITHTLQLSGSTKFELSQRRLVTFETQRNGRNCGRQSSAPNLGAYGAYRPWLLQSFNHPAIRGQANPDYMNTSQPLIAKFRNLKCKFVKFGGPYFWILSKKLVKVY